jgi:hypothetical protein
MASSKISELVDAGNLLPGDETIIVRNGANFKVDPTINAVQAWVNFNGTGTVAIRASYNVSSITDNGTGDYTVNFANALTDANYALAASGFLGTSSGTYIPIIGIRNESSYSTVVTTTSIRIVGIGHDGTSYDWECVNASIIR